MRHSVLRTQLVFYFLIVIASFLSAAPAVLTKDSRQLTFQSYRFRSDFYDKDKAASFVELPISDSSFSEYKYEKLPSLSGKELKVYTFKTEFQINKALKDELFSVYITPVESPYALYVNGIQIGVLGQYENQYNSFKFEATRLNIPSNLLHFGNDANEFTVQVFAVFERNPVSEITVGTHYEIEKELFVRNLFTRSFNQMVVMLTLVISIYFIYIHFLSDKSDLKYLLFAFTCFFYTFANINLFVNWESANEVVLLKISRTAFVVTGAFLSMFTASFSGYFHKLKKTIVAINLIMALSVFFILIQQDKLGIWKIFNTISIAYLALLYVFGVFLLILAARKGVKGSVFVIGGYIALILFSLLDMHDLLLSITPYFWRVPYGYFLLCLTIFYVLAFEHSLILAKSKEQERALRIINQEIKKRERIEHELIRARDEAYKANEVKSEFLANMSHEIRTPLNGIMGFAELLAYSNNPEEQENCTKQILSESEHLMNLLNDVLDLSKIEAGKLNLNMEVVPIRDYTKSLFNSIQGIAYKKGLDCSLDIDTDMPEYVSADPIRLNQILLNLLTNAVKFTEKGVISFGLAYQPKEGNALNMIFTVKDTGIGIKEEFLSKLFESFVQVDSTSTRKYGGSGLGTAIAKQLVDIMGGTIEVESEVGKGSLFTVTIPTEYKEVDNSKIKKDAGEKTLHGSRHALVLLVEDYRPNQIIAQSHLKALNCDVLIARDGEEAIEIFKSHTVDVILMDIQLPKIDGLEATRIIKEMPNGKNVPVLALTANAGSDLKKACLEAGMVDVITKPFRRNTFLSKINDILATEYIVKEETSLLSDDFSLPLAFQNLLFEAGGDIDTAVEMVDTFVASVSLQLTLIKNSGYSDPSLVQKEAHKIKGGALSLFWEPLANYASLLEDAAKSGIENFPDLIEDLETEFYAVKIDWGNLRPELLQ